MEVLDALHRGECVYCHGNYGRFNGKRELLSFLSAQEHSCLSGENGKEHKSFQVLIVSSIFCCALSELSIIGIKLLSANKPQRPLDLPLLQIFGFQSLLSTIKWVLRTSPQLSGKLAITDSSNRFHMKHQLLPAFAFS